jgi:hypothetical protein
MTSAMDRAYVALLHGDKSEFFLYALLLGFRLRHLDAECDRWLLVARKSYRSVTDRACLGRVWKVEEVDLVNLPALDKTRCKRHRYVFTKLHAFHVPFSKVVFFDLDVVVRGNPSELFSVQAPAGMYHGCFYYRMLARHGVELPSDAFFFRDMSYGCINAGLMRIDPQPTESERKLQVTKMISTASELQSCDASYLPEQYFLVRILTRWHHIDVRWNCEVCPRYYVGDRGQVVCTQSELPMDWLLLGHNQASLQANVCMFHFSGTWLQPWWFIHLGAEKGHDFVRHQLEHRDPPGLVALAVHEWLAGMEKMRQSTIFTPNEKASIDAHVSGLAWTAANWWEANDVCSVCGKLLYFGSVLGYCEECQVRSHAARAHSIGRQGCGRKRNCSRGFLHA